MLYLRTASGSFINAASIVQLTPQRAGLADEITSWVAICEGGKAVTLAPYYAVSGRIEMVLASVRATAADNSMSATNMALCCPAEDCPCA
jgi:hypothetical protein